MRDIRVMCRERFFSRSAGWSVVGRLTVLVLSVFPIVWIETPAAGGAQETAPVSRDDAAVTFPANLDGDFRKTQFYAPSYNTGVGQWDSRIEFWLPPGRNKFSWGPYVRIAGIAGSQSDAWQNEWIAAPGAGLQMFPFSKAQFRDPRSKVGAILGPLRVFGEYNFVDYWGASNTWRPRNQVLAGLDYWKAVHVNDSSGAWWTEIWNGLYWQNSNEFTDRYDSVVFANSVRLGVRAPNLGALSTLTPYLLAQSSRTKYDYAGQSTDFYWENALIGGGGVRVAPPLHADVERSQGVTRLAIYGEFLDTARYYGSTAPATVPRYDIRAGVSLSIGDWFK